MTRTYALVILDGWGLGPADQTNPIHAAQPETIARIEARYPGVALQASGIAVGLPFSEEGNSEVGHLTLGAGRTLEPPSERIARAAADGSFAKNPAFTDAFAHARANRSTVHVITILTSGVVHASLAHLEAFLAIAAREQDVPVALHLMTDGIDSAPREARALLARLAAAQARAPKARIASLGGRWYGMDRDRHFERTREAYRAFTGEAPHAASPEDALARAYLKGLNDEFVEPRTIEGARGITDGDAVVFMNFREDSMRQIADAFLFPDFREFPRVPLARVKFITMTEYRREYPAAVAFPALPVPNPLGAVLAARGLRDLRIAETEKYAHVTYFFNGRREEPFPNEFRVLVPSLGIPRKDERPEMMAHAVTDRAVLALQERSFDFILVNYANPDLIAHTGNYAATVAAVETVDRELARLLTVVEESGHAMIVTADHGNAEVLLDPRTGEPETRHNPSPVPCWIVAPELADRSPLRPRAESVDGLLADVAPTILELMGIPAPEEMTGTSLLSLLR